MTYNSHFPACDPLCNPLILNTPKWCAHGFSNLRPVLEVIDIKRFTPVCARPYVLHTYEPAPWGGGLKKLGDGSPDRHSRRYPRELAPDYDLHESRFKATDYKIPYQ